MPNNRENDHLITSCCEVQVGFPNLCVGVLFVGSASLQWLFWLIIFYWIFAFQGTEER